MGNGNTSIDTFKTELVEYDDPKAFHLNLAVVSKKGEKYKRTIRINDNRPKGRVIDNGNYLYIDYSLSLPFFQVDTDENETIDFYFLKDDTFRLIIDYKHYMDITPVFGKKMDLTVYLD